LEVDSGPFALGALGCFYPDELGLQLERVALSSGVVDVGEEGWVEATYSSRHLE
jgi:hypothetical protein